MPLYFNSGPIWRCLLGGAEQPLTRIETAVETAVHYFCTTPTQANMARNLKGISSTYQKYRLPPGEAKYHK
jgi:hypothetical protein